VRRVISRAAVAKAPLTGTGLSLLLLIAGCAGGPLVERVNDGHVVEGRSIEPAAYSAFLTGAIAEASGDPRSALPWYERAARLDSQSPETWARIGAARCTIRRDDRRADDAFARAISIDERYAGAWTAKARCAQARGDQRATLDAARRAAELDPSADGANALLARLSRLSGSEAPGPAGASSSAGTESVVRDPATRDALVALTETASDRVAAWEALAAWAESQGDVALWARSLEALVKIAPARRDAVARAAEELAGNGQVGAARAVAAAAADAGEGPLAADRHPLAARLAVDEAIAGGDVDAVRLRATRARISLEESSARALLAGNRDLARTIAADLARAEPGGAARLVLAAGAAGEAGDAIGVAWDVRRHGARASASTTVAFGTTVARGASPDEARATLAAVTMDPIVAGDDRVVRPAVELASRGTLELRALPPDGLVELAVLRGRSSAEGLSLPDRRALDARHEFLAASLADPAGARTKELYERLASVASTDPVVAAATALVQVGTGLPVDPAAAGALLKRDPADPLLAATALLLANKAGDADVAGRARATLTALGTPPPVETATPTSGAADSKKSGATF
jgi:hypothetical protein